jgi:hypothetical protein
MTTKIPIRCGSLKIGDYFVHPNERDIRYRIIGHDHKRPLNAWRVKVVGGYGRPLGHVVLAWKDDLVEPLDK